MESNYVFVPSYYEWHLLDEEGNILHNMTDPSEAMLREDGTPLSLTELIDYCAADLHAAEWAYSEGKEYNGIMLDNGFTPAEEKTAAEIMAKALYNYYTA